MNGFDIVAAVVVGVLTVIGFLKGMVRQIFGLVGVILGIFLATVYYQLCSRFLTSLHPGTAKAIAFIAIFFSCIFLAHILAWAVERFFESLRLGFLNRIGGAFLGFIKGVIIIAVVVMALTSFLSPNIGFLKTSHSIKYIRPVVLVLKKVSREEIRAKYNEKMGKKESASPGQK